MIVAAMSLARNRRGDDQREAAKIALMDGKLDSIRSGVDDIRIEQKVEREQVAKVTGTNKDDSVQKGPVKNAEKKVYPNDPCPCGSGKKFKNCHGRPGMSWPEK